MIKRDERIDSLRGLFLIIMTIDHFGGGLRTITNQTFGYVSAAEGFIFLSGFVFSIVYMRHINNTVFLVKRSIKRSFVIYKYNITLVAIVALLTFIVPQYKIYWLEFLYPFYSNPGYYLKYEILLMHQPIYMDILPLYCIFVLISPVLLIALTKGWGLVIVMTSLCCWVLGQYFNTVRMLIDVFCIECRPGFFNLLAWQLIWVLGIYAGFLSYSNKKIKLLDNHVFILTVFFLGFILFLGRHYINIGIDDVFAISRSNIGWLRVLNFSILVILTTYILQHIPRGKGIPWVKYLGKYSLQVFSFHVLLLYLFSPLNKLVIDTFGSFGYSLYVIFIVISLTIPAYAYEKYKASAA